MKRVLETLLFIAIIIVLPGGFILAVKKIAQRVKPKFLVGLLALGELSGCVRLQYQDEHVKIRGISLNPEAAMMMSAQAQAKQSEAYAVRSCSDDPRRCGAVWGAWGAYGAGMMDTPAGYTWGGMQAAGQATVTAGPAVRSPSDNSSLAALARGQRETNIYLRALAGSQEKFQRALAQKKASAKNKKTAKRAAKKGKR